MPLHFAILLSVTLHAALVFVPNWLVTKQHTLNTAQLEARLVAPAKPAAIAEALSTEAVSTEADGADAAATSLPAETRPRTLRREALRRAQTALSKHLFYPPEAIARGLEGEVILLLILSDSGQLVSASIARSSGHAILDQAALDAVRNLGALPGNSRQTLFPVNFRLQ